MNAEKRMSTENTSFVRTTVIEERSNVHNYTTKFILPAHLILNHSINCSKQQVLYHRHTSKPFQTHKCLSSPVNKRKTIQQYVINIYKKS